MSYLQNSAPQDDVAPASGTEAVRRDANHLTRWGYRPLDHRCCPGREEARAEGDVDQRFVREAVAHREYLVHRAWGLTRQHADAEDLVQQTLLKAYLSFDTFREGTNLRSWLYRIMHNTWVDGYRSSQRRPLEQLSAEITDAQLQEFAVQGPSGLNSAEAEAMKGQPGEAMSALRTLPDDLREVIFYADIEGYRNTEIARVLGIPVGTVGSRLHRGRTLLRETLVSNGDSRIVDDVA